MQPILDTMQVKSFLGGFDKNFSYLIWCTDTREAAIIDAAVEISPILETIKAHNLKLNDKNTLLSLKQLYYMNGNYEKSEEMKKLIADLDKE